MDLNHLNIFYSDSDSDSLPNKNNKFLDFIYNGKEIFHCSKQEIEYKKKAWISPGSSLRF